MTERKADLVRWRDIRESFGLLTRLPSGGTHERRAAAAWAWPLAGLGVAILAAGVGAAGMAAGLTPWFAAGLALAGLVLLTGGLHEDGLADSADGFWGGATPARRLEIMKDSRTGAYGVIALVLGLGLRWSAVASLLDAGVLLPGLIAAAMLSRAAMAGLMAALRLARDGGLSAATGRPSVRTALLAAAVGAVGSVLALGGAGVGAMLLVIAVAALWGGIARAKVGGQTGDVLGAGQQLTEIAVLGFAAALV